METSLAAIMYYAREGFWHTMQEACADELRNGADPILVFWSAYSMFKEGDITHAIREAEQIINRSEVMLPAFIALKKFHNSCRLVDQEAVDKISFRLGEMKNNAPEIAYVVTAQYYYLQGQTEKATSYADIALRKNEHNLQALCIKSWCNIRSEESARSFDYIIESSGDQQFTRFPDAVMGKVKFLEQKKKFQEIIEILNELVVMNPKFVPALVEKAKVQMMVGDWDQSLETAQRMLMTDPFNIEGLRIQIFHLLAREANAEMACDKLNEIGKALAKKEPRNAMLYINITMPIARICGRKDNVLKKCLALTQQARKLSPDNSAVIAEVGHQLMLLADYNGAITTFTEASQKDEGNVDPLYKIVHCRILQGQLQDAEGQMEFLSEIESSTGAKSAELVFYQALLTWRSAQNKRESLRFLDESLSLHVGASKQLMPGYDFYTKLNPDFLLEMAKEYLQHVGLSPLPIGVKAPSHLVRGTKLLETITKQIPGIIEAQLLLAKAKFVGNEHQAAQRYIQICLQMDPNFVDALLLSAMINFHNEQYMGAASALEQAISHNFRIRDNPLFMLVKGQVELKNNQPLEALRTLEAAFNLPGVTTPAENKKGGLFLSFSQEDKAGLYIALAQAYQENGKLAEASGKIMEAIGEFTGTSEEVKVLIANSELSLRKGEVKQALDMLKTVTADSPHYKAARIAMADIYLKHTGDRRLYAKCFSDIVESEKTVANYLLLGEAFMKIQEPEEAIRVYQKALEQKPNDLFLTREIGRALVLTHDYEQAIRYYKDSIATSQNTSLMTDLANLFLRQNNFMEANRVLDEALRANLTDIDSLRASVQNYVLRSKVHVAMKRDEDPLDLQPIPPALQALQAGKTCQKDLLSRSRDLSHDQVSIEKELYSQIMFQIGEYYETRDKNADSQENAFNAYNEALIYNDQNEKCVTTLAKFHMKRGELDQCMKQCNSLLQQNPSHEFASSMMCEILIQQNKTDEAIQHYQKLLSGDPDNYRGLAKLILLLRRAGKLKDAEQYITKAEKARKSSGLSYCKGLYHRYTGNPQDSLTHFNAARSDNEYAESALKWMIEIYLNPDNEPMWMERSTTQENIRAAEVLLGELNSKGQTLRSAIYHCMILICTNTRASILRASEVANEIYNQNPTFVPAIIMMASGNIAENTGDSGRQARDRLNTINSHPYQPEFADDFEKGWLMLAELNIQADNYAGANEMCAQCLRYNASCGKAEELIGLIKEKENQYDESSTHYQNAWKLSNMASASIGFRLALNYLKANKLVECIQICAAVLKLYPDYPNIREQIMQRAQESLRP